MNSDGVLSRGRRFAVQLLCLLYLVALGLLILALYPYTVGTTPDAIPWKWNSPIVCLVLWFLDSAVWLPLAFVLSLPIAVYCYTSRAGGWPLISAIAGLVLLSTILIGTPYYIESLGQIPTSQISATIRTHRDFFKPMSAGIFILFPIILAVIAPRPVAAGSSHESAKSPGS